MILFLCCTTWYFISVLLQSLNFYLILSYLISNHILQQYLTCSDCVSEGLFLPWGSPSDRAQTPQTHRTQTSPCRRTWSGCSNLYAAAETRRHGGGKEEVTRKWGGWKERVNKKVRAHTWPAMTSRISEIRDMDVLKILYIMSKRCLTVLSSILWFSVKSPSVCFSSFRITGWQRQTNNTHIKWKYTIISFFFHNLINMDFF